MTAFVKKNPIVAYLVVAFGISWAVWSILIVTTPPAVLQSGSPPPLFLLFAALGGVGPTLAGIVIAAVIYNDGASFAPSPVKSPIRPGIQWYTASVLISPLVGTATIFMERILGKQTASREEMMDTLPLSVVYPLFAALGEEFGWRGFLLPRLLQKYSALTSSILVGLAWGLWHIPTQVIAWRQDGFMIVAANVIVTHVVGIAAQSIVMTWIYINANGSMLLMILMHYSITFTAMYMFPLSLSANEIIQHWLIYDAFYWLVAAGAIAHCGWDLMIHGSQEKKRR